MTKINKRPTCQHCLRPEKTCVCKFAVAIANKIPVVILQHTDEVTHAKNTGRLLHLCLQESDLLIGEVFDEKRLHLELNEKNTRRYFDVLLYPDSTDYSSLNITPPPALDWTRLDLSKQDDSRESLNNRLLRLWVIDATWRKSRKMLYLNPFLQKMPRLPLNLPEPGNYFIRKAADKNQLSTFEATCYALQLLEKRFLTQGQPLDNQSLSTTLESNNVERALVAFESFVHEQAHYFKF